MVRLVGGLISYDFLAFYSGGYIYWTDIDHLYNLNALAQLQNQLIGIPETGVNAFRFPPFMGFIYGLFSFTSYLPAFILWTILSLACLILSSVLLSHHLIPKSLHQSRMKAGYLMVIILSFYPTLFGLQNGQNHCHSLLLITLIIILSQTKYKFWTGFCAAFLLYKPQIVIGWLLVWLLTKNWRTLLSFSLTGSLWVGLTVLHRGISPYLHKTAQAAQ